MRHVFQEMTPGDRWRAKAAIWVLVCLLILGAGHYLWRNNAGFKLLYDTYGPAIEQMLEDASEPAPTEQKTAPSLVGDDDQDRLSNLLELVLASDPKSKDTDQDGYTDFEEWFAGYDPVVKDAVLDEAVLAQRVAVFAAKPGYAKYNGLLIHYEALRQAHVEAGNTSRVFEIDAKLRELKGR